MSDVLREGLQHGDWKNKSPNEGWVKVQRKRMQNRFIGMKGKAEVGPQSTFRAAEVNVPFYIYNVNRDTSMDDIVSYIKSKTDVDVSLKKIDMKRNKGYAAYKFSIPKQKLTVFMNEDLWPAGVSFRRFVYYNSTTEPWQNEVKSSNRIDINKSN